MMKLENELENEFLDLDIDIQQAMLKLEKKKVNKTQINAEIIALEKELEDYRTDKPTGMSYPTFKKWYKTIDALKGKIKRRINKLSPILPTALFNRLYKHCVKADDDYYIHDTIYEHYKRYLSDWQYLQLDGHAARIWRAK